VYFATREAVHGKNINTGRKIIYFSLVALSRFHFTSPQSRRQTTREQKLNEDEKSPMTDEDGDMLVRRSQDGQVEESVITIGTVIHLNL
jgi:hypothetical protein